MATKKEETKKEVWYNAAGQQGTGNGYIYSDPKYIPNEQTMQKTTTTIYDTVNTSRNRTGYNDADLAAAASAGKYTGGGSYSAEDVYKAIQREKEIYNEAMSRGDTAAADAAHKRAEAWRATAGYSGGADGSEYIRLGGAGIGSMGFTNNSNKTYEEKLREQQRANQNGGYMVYYDGVSGGEEPYTPSAGYEYLKGQAVGINNDADDLARQMYVNYMKNTNRTNELMGLAGLQGSGLQESSLIDAGNTYQEQLFRNEQARNESLQAIRTEIASMLASGQITQEEADALYAGIAGGSYDVKMPQSMGGGGGYAVYYPGEQQTVNPYAPTMTDAEMYQMLRSLGMGNDQIDTYFTAGQAAPTLQQIVAEREALRNPVAPVVPETVLVATPPVVDEPVPVKNPPVGNKSAESMLYALELSPQVRSIVDAANAATPAERAAYLDEMMRSGMYSNQEIDLAREAMGLGIGPGYTQGNYLDNASKNFQNAITPESIARSDANKGAKELQAYAQKVQGTTVPGSQILANAMASGYTQPTPYFVESPYYQPRNEEERLSQVYKVLNKWQKELSPSDFQKYRNELVSSGGASRMDISRWLQETPEERQRIANMTPNLSNAIMNTNLSAGKIEMLDRWYRANTTAGFERAAQNALVNGTLTENELRKWMDMRGLT